MSAKDKNLDKTRLESTQPDMADAVEPAFDHTVIRAEETSNENSSSGSPGNLDQTVIGEATPADSEETVEYHGDNRDTKPDESFETDAPVATENDVAGCLIGEYRIVGELGRGGMGVVYRARHQQLDRDAAIKMILHGRHSGADAQQRFLTEARSVAQLQHPNIVQIFDIGEHDGLPYFSLELVRGTDLQKTLAKRPQPAMDSAKMIHTLALAMEYAHGEGIVHRDLKPANVLISETGDPKISDFGLAKLTTNGDSRSTRTGTIMGSPSYMSPEQAEGKTHAIGPGSDQYSLGAMLYEMLTGRPPFLAAKPLETILQVVNSQPVAPRELQPNVPRDLETICLKALRKDPAHRYASCAELAADLDRFTNGVPISARPVGAIERAWRWCRRNPVVATTSTLAITGLVLALGVATVAYFKVADQNELITKQKEIAERKTKEAQQQQERADEQKSVAETRSQLVLRTMQNVLTDVDQKLQDDPQSDKARESLLNILNQMVESMDEDLRENPETSAVPTVMALRHRMAGLYTQLGKTAEAEQVLAALYRLAVDRMEFKKRSDASRFNVGLIAKAWASARRSAGMSEQDQLEVADKSESILRDILENPDDPRQEGAPSSLVVGINLADTTTLKGIINSSGYDVAAAEELYRTTFRELGELQADLKANPKLSGRFTVKQVEDDLARRRDSCRLGMASCRVRLDQVDEGLALFDESIEYNRSQVSDPKQLSRHRQYAVACRNAAEAHLWAGQLEKAAELQQQAEPFFRRASEANSANLLAKERLADLLYEMSVVADECGNGQHAKRFLDEARTLHGEIYAAEAKPSQQVDYMLSLARSEQTSDARNVLAETDGALNTTIHLLARARALALISQASQDDADQDAAIKALRNAIRAGYSDRFRLQVEPDFKALRSLPQFESLVNELGTP